MSWFKKKSAAEAKSKPENDALRDATVEAINILMRSACELEKCWVDLERTGLPNESLSLLCNLTVLACSEELLQTILAKDQIPDHFLFTDPFGTQQVARFKDSEIYRTAKTVIREYGPVAAKVAETSKQLEVVRGCIDMLGSSAEEDVARIRLSPPVLPVFGPAVTVAKILPRVGGASMALKRRTEYEKKYFKGKGLDVGGGCDSIEQHASLLGFDSCRNWDLADGDAQYLADIPDSTFDFLHSSHCLEHMVDPGIALANWIRVVRPGGYLVVIVPDEEMYEHLHWPSNYNGDHKWSFTIYSAVPRLPKSLNILDCLMPFAEQVEIIKIERIEAGYRHDLGDVDQTSLATAECSIEFILRKSIPACPNTIESNDQ